MQTESNISRMLELISLNLLEKCEMLKVIPNAANKAELVKCFQIKCFQLCFISAAYLHVAEPLKSSIMIWMNK